jgi:hypothetical protein
VCTYQVSWGKRCASGTGATQGRMCRSPTGQRAPPCVMWRFDWRTSLIRATEPVGSAGGVSTYRVSRGIDGRARRSHPRPYQPRSDRATGPHSAASCVPSHLQCGGGNKHGGLVATCLPGRKDRRTTYAGRRSGRGPSGPAAAATWLLNALDRTVPA